MTPTVTVEDLQQLKQQNAQLLRTLMRVKQERDALVAQPAALQPGDNEHYTFGDREHGALRLMRCMAPKRASRITAEAPADTRGRLKAIYRASSASSIGSSPR